MPRSASVVAKAACHSLRGRGAGDPLQFRAQRRRPFAPALGGEAQEDLLARLEVAQQRRLVHADGVGDVGQRDLPDTALRRRASVPRPGSRLRAAAWPRDCGPAGSPGYPCRRCYRNTVALLTQRCFTKVMTQTWFITGSSRGFGRALTRAALAAGDRVAATARRPEQLDDLVAAYGRIACKRWPSTSPTRRPPTRRSARRATASAASTSSSTTPATPTSRPSRPATTPTSASSSRPTSGASTTSRRRRSPCCASKAAA